MTGDTMTGQLLGRANRFTDVAPTQGAAMERLLDRMNATPQCRIAKMRSHTTEQWNEAIAILRAPSVKKGGG